MSSLFFRCCMLFVLLLAAACSLPGGNGPIGPTVTVTSPTGTGQTGTDQTQVVDTLPPTASPTPEAPLKDLSARPQIWFGPLDPWSWDRYFPGAGPFEFYDLFQKNAPWHQASDAVHVIRLYPVWLSSYGTLQELKTVIEDIKARGIAFTFEGGPLQEVGVCNAATIEGFAGAPGAALIANRIKTAGGTLYGMDLEHGFDAATYYDPACRKSPQEIAADAAITIQAVRQVFPDIKIGSIETANLDVQDVADWMTAYREVMGEELDYFHLDINYTRVDWPERAREIEAYVESRGVDFGIFYFGNAEDVSDLEWLQHAEDRFVEYEARYQGTPGHAIFQSWHPHPQKLIPETDRDSFTHLILRYLRPRTRLSLEKVDDLTLQGTLALENGHPLPGKDVELFARPLDGDGIRFDYTVSGLVPEGATRGNVGIRVNMECDCSGEAVFSLEQALYSEAGENVNRVPNGSFANGMNGWGFWGNGSVNFVPGGSGPGNAVAFQAATTQGIGGNSDFFPVQLGNPFSVTFTAAVSPQTSAAGYFAIFFLNDQTEVQRMTVEIEPANVLVDTAVTQSDGSYQINLEGLPPGSYEFAAWFQGSEQYWPAYLALVSQE